MNILISIIGAILALSFIIVVHEFGHYWVARRCGVFVERFSIGFGRALYSRTLANGMEFKIGWLPLGGYVKLRGDELDNTHPNRDDHYANKPVWQRMLIVLAGPMINFLLAIIIYWGIYLAGIPTIKPIIQAIAPNTPAAQANLKPKDEILAVNQSPVHSWSRTLILLVTHYKNSDPVMLTVKNTHSNQQRTVALPLQHWELNPRNQNVLLSLGIQPIEPIITNQIEHITANSPAEKAGLKPQDRLTKINGHAITSWQDFVTHLHTIHHGPITVSYQRDKTIHQTVMTPEYIDQNGKKIPMLGIQAQLKWPEHAKTILRYSFFDALSQGVYETSSIIQLNAVVLAKLITGNFPMQALGGPVMIFKTAGSVSHMGIIPYLLFIAYISVAIGFMNLLPIPGLDGGHFLLQIIEAIRRKPISPRWQMKFFTLGFSLLIILVIVVTYNDVRLLFSSH
jgi:regulator of sigma E protease